MREVEFRGKSSDDGSWIYGYYMPDMLELAGKEIDWAFIKTYDLSEKKTSTFEVIKETIGQYTGLKDQNGNKIFEGDIIIVGSDKDPRFRYIIEWLERSANYLARQNGTTGYIGTGYGFDEWEVIGNIHDNPELLEER